MRTRDTQPATPRQVLGGCAAMLGIIVASPVVLGLAALAFKTWLHWCDVVFRALGLQP